MRFGANTLIWTMAFEPQHFDLLPRIKEAGLDGVEIPVFNPGAVPAAAIRKELEKNGLACTTCTVIPNGMSLIAGDADLRRRTREHVGVCLKTTAELGAKLLVGPIYSPVGAFTGTRRTDEEWRNGVESWRELASTVEASGVDVALEPLNRFETYFLNIAEDAARFCDEIGNEHVGMMVDTFHANIEEKSIGAAIKRAGRHLKHLHTCENDRGIPGTGNVAWPEFFRTVREIGYDGWLTIESFGFSLGEIAAAASIWRDLAPTPEAIPFEGVKFLKAGVS